MRANIRYILVGLALFTFFFVIRFPYDNLSGHICQWIFKRTGIYVGAEGMGLNLFGWPGLELRRFTVALPLAGSELEISGERLVVRAGVGGLFPPRLAVSATFEKLKKGGDGYIKFLQPNDSVDGKLDLRDVNLEQLHPSGLQKILQGAITTSGTFSIHLSDASLSTGDLNLQLKQLKLLPQNLQGIVIPSMNFGNTRSRTVIRNGIVELGTFKFGDAQSDLEGNLTGEIRLNKEFVRSFLAATLRLRLSEGFTKSPGSETITAFLSTYKTQDREFAMRWNSTFADMASNAFNAIPQRAQ